MKTEITFPENPDREVHACESRQEGDWIIYTCPKCPNYKRRVNIVTREVILTNDDISFYVFHQGNFVPEPLKEFDSMQN